MSNDLRPSPHKMLVTIYLICFNAQIVFTATASILAGKVARYIEEARPKSDPLSLAVVHYTLGIALAAIWFYSSLLSYYFIRSRRNNPILRQSSWPFYGITSLVWVVLWLIGALMFESELRAFNDKGTACADILSAGQCGTVQAFRAFTWICFGKSAIVLALTVYFNWRHPSRSDGEGSAEMDVPLEALDSTTPLPPPVYAERDVNAPAPLARKGDEVDEGKRDASD